MKKSVALQIQIAAMMILLLVGAAYYGRNSAETMSLNAIAGYLLLLIIAISFETPRAQKVTVLVPNFLEQQWYANIEIDHEGRLLAPADPFARILSPANGVTRGIQILRAPHYEPRRSSIVMLGAVYEIAPK